MGQTLSHGVYLPNEGERNCYAGLASNWQILNTAVGAIAEKAPLVHTHTVSQITDFPAYGTTAGTICEGNDSRLSDARTPVAHTHTKSDVTNLFNSANTWTGDNTFTKFVKNAPTGLDISENPSSKIDTGFRIVDKDGNIISNLQYTKGTSGNSQIALNLRTKDSNNVLLDRSVCLNTDQYGTWCDFKPSVNNTISLGSSSYQWKSVYAQSYYYKGVACGDILTHNVSEFVDVSGNQTIGGVKTFSQEVTMFGRDINLMSRLHYGKNSNPSDSCWHYVFFRGNTASEGYTNAWYSGFLEQLVNPDGSVRGRWVIRNTNENSTGIQLTKSADGSSSSLIPVFSSIDLGTSTNKWKTLNGINPGALSFPDYNRFEPIDFSKWDVNLGWDNLYTPSEDGWLYAEINDAATNSIYLYSSGLQPVQSVNRKYGISAQGNGSQSGYGGRLAIMIPVRKDIQYRFLIKASTVSDIYAVTFYPCLGNV